MAFSVTHAKVSGKPAGNDPDRVYGTHWDAAHAITGTASVEQGGTGLSSYTIGDILYADTATSLAKLAGVATGSVLVSGGVATAPAWSSAPTITGAVTAARFVPSSSTVPTNGMYLPASNTLGWAVNSAAELQLTASALSPAVSDGNALGTTSLMWADLFLASGGVINWNNGDVTVTHSSNTLAFGGASSGYTFDAVVAPASSDGAALGSTSLMWSDIFLASGAVLNFNNGNYTLTHSSGLLTASGNFTAVQINATDYMQVTGNFPNLYLHKANGSTNQKYWRFSGQTDGSFVFEALSDAFAATTAFSITRSASTPTNFNIPITTAATAYNSAALTVAGGLGVGGDIYLASGKKFDFGSGNYTLTHSSGLLTLSGDLNVLKASGDLAITYRSYASGTVRFNMVSTIPSYNSFVSQDGSAATQWRFGANGTTATEFRIWVGNSETLAATFTTASAFFPLVYSDTDASAANVYVASDGRLKRSTSSLAYKENVEDYSRGLADVMKIRPVFFSPKGSPYERFGGFVAEEIFAAGLTEFVSLRDGKPDALHYGHMTALAIKGIQDHKSETDRMAEEIVALRGRVASLENAH